MILLEMLRNPFNMKRLRFRSTHLPTYLSIYLPTYLSIYLSIRLPIHLHLWIDPSSHRLLSFTHWAAVLTETPCLRSAPEAGRQALPDHRAHQHEAGVAGKDGRGAKRRLSANLLPVGWRRQVAAGYDWRSKKQKKIACLVWVTTFILKGHRHKE